jgi:hypothetical protein
VQTAQFLRRLAKAKARSAPERLRVSAEHAWHHRWTALLAVAAQASFAATLQGHDPWMAGGRDGDTPDLPALFAAAGHEEAPEPSRMPLR